MKLKENGVIKKTINIALDVFIVILGVILLITVYNNIQVKILGRDYASFFGHSVFEVQTGSMGEIIEPGDWIVVKYQKNIKLNDIITFEHKGEYITHRVIEVYNDTYVTKGDANTAKDTPINKSQIVGKVVKVIPNFGILRKTIFNPIVLIAIIITLFFLNQVFKKPSEKDLLKEKELLNKLRTLVEPKQKPKKEKTRVVQEEVKEEKKEEVVEEIKEVPVEEEISEEVKEQLKKELENTSDMEKTLFFRMVSVDKDELSNVYEEIPKEIEEQSDTVKKNIKDGEKAEVEEISEDKIKSKLELIQRKKKKCKNIIEKAMLIKKEEIIELIMLLNKGEELKNNEPTIKEKLVDAYIDAKYYNNCGNYNISYNGKNMLLRLDALMEQVGENLIKSYKESDTKYSEKVEKLVKFMCLINHLEEDFKIEDLTKKKDTYNKRILKYIKFNDMSQQDLKKLITNILKTQKTYTGMIKFIQSKIETNMFELKFNKLTRKDMYGVELTHNIQFSKVYSEYIVDKTYSEGIIAEDKIKVLGNLLMSQLVKDMFQGEFNKKYFVYIPESLYSKDNKLDKVFEMFDDEMAKKNINILLAYNGLSDNKKVVKQLIKQGYNFSVDMNDVELLKKSDIQDLYILDYIFISRKKIAKTNIIDVLPEEVKPKILYEEISSKIGNF